MRLCSRLDLFQTMDTSSALLLGHHDGAELCLALVGEAVASADGVLVEPSHGTDLLVISPSHCDTGEPDLSDHFYTTLAQGPETSRPTEGVGGRGRALGPVPWCVGPART